MELVKKVIRTVEKYGMLYGGERVLIALSGGPDSVCLLDVLNALKERWRLSLSALYIEHGLRPEETPGEIEFCKNITERYGVEFNVVSINVRDYAEKEGITLQEAGRILRYLCLEQEALRTDADRIATGHHADDQAETIIMRLIRGAGRRGLSGIPPVRGKVIRPLIELSRDEIEEYISSKGLDYVVDSSNLKDEYFRNRIRREVIPILKRFNPNLLNTLSRTAHILREEDDFINAFVHKALMRLISRKTSDTVELFLSPLEALDRVILRRALLRVIDETRGLRSIKMENIEYIIDLIKKGSSGDRIYLPGGIRAIRGYSTLVITSKKPQRIEECELKVPGETLIKEAGVVLIATIEENVGSYGDGKEVACFDIDSLRFPLKIRARKEGDFFYPFGLGKRKKLQDFFVDEKVPRDIRDSVPLLISGEDIIWVVGYRTDERYRVGPSADRVLKITVRLSRF